MFVLKKEGLLLFSEHLTKFVYICQEKIYKSKDIIFVKIYGAYLE